MFLMDILVPAPLGGPSSLRRWWPILIAFILFPWLVYSIRSFLRIAQLHVPGKWARYSLSIALAMAPVSRCGTKK